MKPSPHLLRLSGAAFQKWVWLSTTKYCSPSFSYMGLLSPQWLLDRLQVESQVLGGVLGIGEQQHPIVKDDHTPIVGAHDLLEVVVAEVVPTERLRELFVVEVDPPHAVDPDHRRQVGDGDALLAAHDVGDDVPDLVVHEGDARLVGRAAVRRERGHDGTSVVVSSPMSPSRLDWRSRERSSESSKRTTFSEICDQIGCSCRAAAIASSDQLRSQPWSTSRFASPCASSSTSMR